MSKRAFRDNSDAGSLFPFLAVLLCTMGALLVLLVVLAQRAAEGTVADVQTETTQQPEAIQQPEPAPATSSADAEEAAALEQQLDQILKSQQLVKTRRIEAEKRLEEEQAKLSHLEEHTRRVEHELAKLSIAAEQLEATEKNQTVDQDQAEGSLARLKSLIEENEERLEELREQATGKHSYAIVPYKGPNGTFRKPIYIECRKDGVYIQPEGIRLIRSDFSNTSWPGNPLAAALRATREYQNAEAAKAGEHEPPDPYPLLLVRPDGIEAYSAARAAITSWDSDYGYEFIAGDWKLDFPDLPNPQLIQIQNHAILNARDKMAVLARSAPSRFRGMGIAGSGASGYGGTSGSSGFGSGGESDSSSDSDSFADSATGGSPDGNGLAAGQSAAHYGNSPTGEGNSSQQDATSQYGAMPGGDPGGETSGYQSAYSHLGGASGQSGSTGYPPSGETGEGQYAAGQSSSGKSGSTPSGTNSSASGSLAQGGSPSQSGAAGSATSGASSANGSSSSSAAGAQSASTMAGDSQQSSPSMTFSNKQPRNQASIAESQGENWAIKQGRQGSVPIRRPIEVVVRKDQIALLPSRHTTQGVGAEGAVVSLNQPIAQVSDEFVAALRTRVEEWGLAGNGLYWRPVLELKVGPNAQHTANEIVRLLKNSGVEVRLPELAQAGQGANVNAPK